jgi:hypothetical protein
MADNGSQTNDASFLEKRRAPRYPYNVVQHIAEIIDGEMPAPDRFKSVRCLDISRTGFAFYSPKLPGSSELVVALGEEPDLVYLTARIVHSRQVDRCGYTFFRLGCQITGAVDVKDGVFVRTGRGDIDAAFVSMCGVLDGEACASAMSSHT